jgi:SAM-dependent methyltransferase
VITIEFRRFRIVPGHRILDIGCGTGRHLGQTVQNAEVLSVGIDRNIADLKHTIERIRFLDRWSQVRGTWGLIAGDVTSLPLSGHSFDRIICSEVLEHVPDHERALKEIVRILKPNGYVAFSVPRFFPEWICWQLSPAYRNDPGGHIRIYTKKQFYGLLKRFGLTSYGFHFAHALHTPFWWLKCLLKSDEKSSRLIRLYHRFLVWDIMKRPAIVRMLEQILNPIFGKSFVVYARKEQGIHFRENANEERRNSLHERNGVD